jgi:hypothetical protein
MTQHLTVTNYKRLSHQQTMPRAEEVLEARKRVRTRPNGVIPHCTPPVHVKSLLEEMKPQIAIGEAWIVKLYADLEEYRVMRHGAKVARQKAIDARDMALLTAAV